MKTAAEPGPAGSLACDCVIVGGGPAGMIAGLLLARAGVRVTVLEKHADFLRDFRGDTVHPTTLTLLDELGLFEAFDALPHSRIERVRLPLADGSTVQVGDLTRLPVPHPYIAMIPQWDFLNLLAEAGEREPTFELRMNAQVTDLLWEGGQVVGVRYQEHDGGAREVRAQLTLACDGRTSRVRAAAELPVKEYRLGVDAWWFRLPLSPDQEQPTLAPRTGRGSFFVIIPRRGYAQIARLIRKGTDAQLRAAGIEQIRQDIAAAMPDLADGVEELELEDIKVLDVRLNRLRRWHRPGLLCIGDAAHAMSPMGGVGINLAIQDGVAAARRLAGPLLEGRIGDRDVMAVQRRRTPPTVFTQTVQRILHRQFEPLLDADRTLTPPAWLGALFRRFPVLGLVPAWAVGIGVRPEHAPAFARRAPATTAGMTPADERGEALGTSAPERLATRDTMAQRD